MGYLGCASLVHREFSISLSGDGESQGLALGVEGENCGCPLVMPMLVAPIAVAVGLCDAKGLFCRSCQECPIGAVAYITISPGPRTRGCELDPA